MRSISEYLLTHDCDNSTLANLQTAACLWPAMAALSRQKVVIVGAGPVGSLAALYAASRGDQVELYELRGGMEMRPFFLVAWACVMCISLMPRVHLIENITNHTDYPADLRDPSTIPLNFTKSINLTISERGITALQQSGHTEAIEPILNNAIPMHGRMIHGRDLSGDLWEASQAYDVHGRVSEQP